MVKFRIMAGSALLFALFVSSGFADDNKVKWTHKEKNNIISWSQNELEISLEGGESISADIGFESRKSLSRVSMRVAPDLRPFISVTPAYFRKIRKGSTCAVRIDVSVPYGTETGLYEGAIRLERRYKCEDDDSSDDRKKQKGRYGEDGSSDDDSGDYRYVKSRYKIHLLREVLMIRLSIIDDDDDGDGYTDNQGDCDDTDTSINPDATEVCDGSDNNCDNRIDETGIRIISPVDGSTINLADIIVTGTISSCTREAGITVNGVPAEVAEGEFAANDIFLEIGANTLTATATDEDGNTATDTITVYTGDYQDQVYLSADIMSGLSPLDIRFSIDTRTDGQITAYEMDFEGDGTQDQTITDPDNLSFTYEQEGLYYPTVTITDEQGYRYADTIAINVFSRDKADALFREKWEDLGTALINEDIEEALAFFDEGLREVYREQFTGLSSVLTEIGSELGNLRLVDIGDNRAEYEIIVTREGVTYSYFLLFVRDRDGLWKIRAF